MTKSTSVLKHLTEQRAQAVKTAERLLADVTPAQALSFSHADAVESSIDDAVRAADRLDQVAVVVRSEPLTYRADSPYSFFLDAVSAQIGGSPGAEMRVARHKREMAVETERRDVLRRRAFARSAEPMGMERRDLTRVDGAGGNLAPPVWLIDNLGSFPRAGRVVADRVTSIPLPAGTDSVNVPRLTTGSAVAAQVADGAAVQETDIVDAGVTAAVRTLAGQVDASIQLVDQAAAPGFDRVIYADLLADYDRALEVQLINGSGASGQLSGLLTSPGTTVTYTSATPTVAATMSKIGDLASQVSTARQMVPSLAIAHPRRGFWLQSQADAQSRPMNPVDLAAPERDPNAAPIGSLFGMSLALDTAVPANLGAGTNEDRVIVTRAADHLLLEGEPRLNIHADVLSGNLTVRFSLTVYVAFISQRVPSSTGVLVGTGLTTPVFA